MRIRRYCLIFITLFLLGLLLVPTTPSIAHAQESAPVVRAVLFYSPTCGHCQYVIETTLLPMIEKYGKQLEIIGLDITQEYGQTIFQATLKNYNLEQGPVPFLVVDNIYLIGSKNIPEQFPGLVESYLSQGGVDWPDIPGLREAISQSSEADVSTAAVTATQVNDSTVTAPAQSATLQSTPVPATIAPTSVSPMATPGLIPPEAHNLNWTDNFAHDPAGNTLAVLVLAGMLASFGWAVILFQKTNGISLKGNWAWSIPLFCVVGFGVAGYLTYVETAQVTAVCGPVGDCNTVQQSEYSRLFGIIPIGVLGLVGYVAIFIAWLVVRYSYDRLVDFAAISLFVMTAFGTLFSIYLTFLEPFVIGATCAWCLTSAVLMTILMLLSVRPAKAAFSRLAHPRSFYREHMRIGVHDD